MPEIVSDGELHDPPPGAEGILDPGWLTKIGTGLETGVNALFGGAATRGTIAGASPYDIGAAELAATGGIGSPLELPPDPIQSPTISAEAANDRFAPRDLNGKIVPITEQPMPEALAKIIGKQKAESLQRQDILARFAATHSGASTFVSDVIASQLDPVNAALGFVPILGEGTIAARIGGGFLARTAERVVTGAATGAALAVPEAGLKAALLPEEADDYGMRDALRDVFYNAAGMAVLHAGVGAAGDLLRGDLRPNRIVPGETPEVPAAPGPLDAATQNAVMRSAVAQIIEGRPVDVSDFFYHPPRTETAVGLAMAAHEPGIERGEITAAPDVEAQMRRIAPEAFARYDPLVERANQLRAEMADPEATIAPQIDRQIAELRARAEQLRTEQVMPAGATPEEVRARIAQGTTAYEAATREADALARGRAGAIAARVDAARAEFTRVDAQLRDIAATGELARARSQAEATLSAAAASRRVAMGPRPPLPEEALRLAREPPSLREVALRQLALAREGWDPVMSQPELAAANDMVYGKGEAEAEPAAGPPRETVPRETPEGVSFFITQAQKAQLREQGYSDAQIREMKPEEAHRILGVTPTPTVIDSAGFRQQIAAAGGDMSKAGDALVARVEQELARGAEVDYVIGARRIPIVAVERGMLADAQGQRWGLMQLTSAGSRLEIRPPAAPAAEQAAAAGATPEEAMLEQQVARLPPGALHPDDQAELAKSAEAVAEAGTMRGAFETAASCLMGLVR